MKAIRAAIAVAVSLDRAEERDSDGTKVVAVAGRGREKPLTNDPGEGRAKNRRVERVKKQ